jgi:type I restriction enzyme S subunit
MSNLAQLQHVCTLITDGTHYTPKDVGVGVPFLTVKDMTANGLDFLNCSKISAENFSIACDGNSAPQFGDVLFSKDGTVGKVQLVDENIDFAVLSSIAILRPNKKHLDSKYLAHVLKSEKTINDAIKKKTGSAIRRIILNDLKTIQIPLPSLVEQQRIAALLDTADRILKLRELTLSKIKNLIDTRFSSFINAETNSEKKIGELCNLITKGTTPTSLGFSYSNNGVRFLRAQNIINGKVSLSENDLFIDRTTDNALKRSKIIAGDVLLTIAGTIGRSAVVGNELGELNCNQAVAILRCSGIVNPHYLSAWLASSLAIEQISKSTVTGVISNLSLSQISSLKINLPNLEIQNQFAIELEKINETHQILLKSHISILSLIKSLQHQSFAVN